MIIFAIDMGFDGSGDVLDGAAVAEARCAVLAGFADDRARVALACLTGAAAASGAPLLWTPLATNFIAIVEGVVVAAFDSRRADT